MLLRLDLNGEDSGKARKEREGERVRREVLGWAEYHVMLHLIPSPVRNARPVSAG